MNSLEHLSHGQCIYQILSWFQRTLDIPLVNKEYVELDTGRFGVDLTDCSTGTSDSRSLLLRSVASCTSIPVPGLSWRLAIRAVECYRTLGSGLQLRLESCCSIHQDVTVLMVEKLSLSTIQVNFV